MIASVLFAIPPSGRLGRTALTYALRVAQVPPQFGMCISADWWGCACRWLPRVNTNRSVNDSNGRTSDRSGNIAFA
eukprot:7487645-Pyramimonas_sp.AAC.1